MRILIIGPTGAGKGTQSKFISKLLKLKHIEPGALIRKKAEKDRYIRSFLNKGRLLPNKIVINIVRKHLKRDNFILDGFPRTMVQAKAFKFKPDLVIFLNTNKKNCIKRLLKRKRFDDNLENIKKRYNLYLKRTVPVINYYKKMKYFHEVNGNPPIKVVNKSIKKVLAKCLQQ